MIVFAPVFILGSLGAQHFSLLSRQMRYKEQAVIKLSALFLSILGAIIAAWLGAQYWSLVIMAVIAASVRTIGAWFLCHWRPGLPTWDKEVLEILSFGSGLTGSTLITYFTRNLDNVLIGWYWGSKELGLYTRAYQLLVAPLLMINSPIRPVFINTLSRLADSPERYRRAYLSLLEKITIISMPCVAWLTVTSDWFVLVLLGPEWMGVSTIFRWLSLVALLLPVTYTIGWLFISQNRSWSMFRELGVAGLVTITAIVVALPWGATGVAAAYSISGICITIPMKFWFAGRKGHVQTLDLYRTITPALTAALVSLSALIAFRHFLPVQNAVLGLAIAFLITVVTTLTTLMIIPNGRRSLKDIWTTANMLIRSIKYRQSSTSKEKLSKNRRIDL